MAAVDVRRRSRDDVPALVGAIDRSERIELLYAVDDRAQLVSRSFVDDVPPWDAHAVAEYVRFCEAAIDDHGGVILAADIDGEVAGIVVVAPTFEPLLAWLAFLHVSRPHRRHGVASALWTAAVDLARGSGARRLYVSAAPTGSAVGFYLSRGCQLADPVHPRLFELEPDDIHLVLDL